MDTVWLGVNMALEALRHGTLLVGAPGTGKSLLLKALRLELIRVMKSRSAHRMHIVDFDTKGDLDDIHGAVPDDCPVFHLNPLVHGDVYDVMAELEDPRDIRELFALLIDVTSNEQQKFFPMSARSIGAKLCTRHWQVCRADTRFDDIVNTCNSVQAMKDVARSHPTTLGLLPVLQESHQTGMSIIASLALEMEKFEVPAALYRTNKTGRRVSTASVLKGRRSITRLPFDMKSIETLSPLTRLFLSRFQQRVLARLDRDLMVPVILDELALLPGGIDLTIGSIFGREVGWMPILSFQSYQTAFQAFGKPKLEATLSPLKNMIVFHLPNAADAEIAAKQFGTFEAMVRNESQSVSTSPQGSSFTNGFSLSYTKVDTVTAGMIQDLKVPGPGCPYLDFYQVGVGMKPFRHQVSIDALVGHFFKPLAKAEPRRARDPEDMILHPWGDADRKRLKLV